MTNRAFSITWDYLCPFARNAAEHVLVGLDDGADWDVTFVPFSLAQVHVKEGETPVWDRPDPDSASGVLALQVGLAVRDRDPEAFLRLHMALFAARHDDGRDIREREVVADVVRSVGLDPAAVLGTVADRGPLATLRKEHEEAADGHGVFGVPTFLAGEEAVFVRYMHRPAGDPQDAREAIERVLNLLTGWTDLNEFKRTRVPR